MFCVETENLSHAFAGGESVLRDVSVRVPEGAIYGFLGPNGAGKTTTLRLILGLLKKQHGAIAVFGKTFDHERIEILRNLGSLIESPSLYGHLSARENLAVWQKLYRCPERRITEALATVGLSDTGAKKAAHFSLGMKQRLSLAIALLHEPKLLILDEPTNGLDPNGIIEIRELLQRLNHERGLTIVISSHLLAEIDRLVTHLGVIHRGEMRFQGTLRELRDRQTGGSTIRFRVSDAPKAVEILSAHGAAARAANDELTVAFSAPEAVARMNRALSEAGIDVYEINVVRSDLESVFMELIGTSGRA